MAQELRGAGGGARGAVRARRAIRRAVWAVGSRRAVWARSRCDSGAYRSSGAFRSSGAVRSVGTPDASEPWPSPVPRARGTSSAAPAPASAASVGGVIAHG
ncbi:hypothetical protein TPA0910_66750 [Streptomyces hygroscopicus subsp. sporocinereus]|uniref:Uncharacterized protein n=1 Tax=Streptomyces hygroscopicus TaxID=1912 RepID=A0ABQ3U9H0_STRHY|nr:hypothetical protein TPA0910_66750 [Streptomyces hygroscopicus]